MNALIANTFAAINRAARLFRRRRLDREIDDELAFHLAMRREQLAGDGREDAALDARRQFGNVAVIKEQTRDMWSFLSFETLMQDVRYALRALRRAPAFSVVAIAALAIGIGANSAVFSLVNAVFVQGLPYPEADRLVMLIGNVQRASVERRGNSYLDHLDWRSQSSAFVETAALTGTTSVLRTNAEPERLLTEAVEPGYFRLLGAAPALGRTFRTEESAVPDRDAVTVISDALWTTALGRDPAIIGRHITLGARQYEVIGVMPPGFAPVTDGAMLWIPFANSGTSLDNRGDRGFYTLARLKAGVTVAAAQTEMTAIATRLAAAYPSTNEKRGVEVAPLSTEIFGDLRQPLSALMAAVLFVLLIACMNVANLLVSRADIRQREIALRTALGAGRSRLLRQLITESCVLAALAAIAGLALAAVALRMLVAASPIALPGYVTPTLHWPVVLFTVGITLLTGVLLGLAPAMHASVGRLAESLKTSARGSSAAGSGRLRSVLVVAEVALTVVLLIGAGLMIRSAQNLSAIQPGFDPDDVFTFNISIPVTPATGGREASLAVQPQAVIEAVRSIPGVTSASLVSDVPLAGGSSAVFFAAEGDSTSGAQTVPRAYMHRISEEFFETLRIPLRGGRAFGATDMNPDSTSVIVTEPLAARFWRGQNAVGKRIKLGSVTSQAPWLTIVGIVPELKYRRLPTNPTLDPDIFLPASERSQYGIVVRSAQPPTTIEAAVRSAIRSTSSAIVTYNARPLSQLVRDQTSTPRFTTWLLGVFAAIALGLAVIGLYGVMSYLVDQRRREFGIRLALGASRGGVLRLVLGRSAVLIGLGLTAGVIASTAIMRLMQTQLYEVTMRDPAAMTAVATMALVAMMACLIPAYRATRVDPMLALRNE